MYDTLLIVGFWILFGVASAFIAQSKGDEVVGAFALGLLLGPLGVLIVFMKKPAAAQANTEASVAAPITTVPQLGGDAMTAARSNFCPRCGAGRLTGARFCPDCGQAYDEALTATPPAPPPAPAIAQPAALPAAPPAVDAATPQIDLFAGVAWLIGAALTAYLGFIQLGYVGTILDDGSLQTLGLWNLVAAALTMYFAVRCMTKPTYRLLDASAGWAVLTVVFQGYQIVNGATHWAYIGSTVAALAAGVLSFSARSALPKPAPQPVVWDKDDPANAAKPRAVGRIILGIVAIAIVAAGVYIAYAWFTTSSASSGPVYVDTIHGGTIAPYVDTVHGGTVAP